MTSPLGEADGPEPGVCPERVEECIEIDLDLLALVLQQSVFSSLIPLQPNLSHLT